MSTRQLAKASANTPDDRCCNCGAGVFDYVWVGDEGHLSEISRLGCVEVDGAETIHEWITLCRMCFRLEGELIQQSGHRNHPERLAHYHRMQERMA